MDTPDHETLHGLASAEDERDRFFTMALDLLCIAGPDGYFRRVNPAFDVFGYAPGEMTSRPFLDFVHPDDVPATLAEVQKLGKGIPTIHFENRYRCKDGSYRWLLWSASPDRNGLIFCAAHDVTEQKAAAQQLRDGEERFRLMTTGVIDYAIFMLDPAGQITTWNEGAQRLKGYRADEIIGQHFSRFYPPEEIRAGTPARQLEVAAAEGRFEDLGSWRVRKDGSRFWASVVITAMRDENGKLYGFSKITRDITERHDNLETIRQSQRDFRDVIEKLPTSIMIRAADTLIYVNPATAALTGHASPSGLIGKSLFELVHPSYHHLLAQRMGGTARAQPVVLRVYRADGTTMLVETAPEHVPIVFEGVPAFLTTIRDITEERRAEALLKDHAAQMQSLSLTDELTQLNNRRGFLALGAQQLKMAARTKHSAVVLFIDVDGLKTINDVLGHEVGDAAIMDTAGILRSTFRDVDILARLGGDEFVTMIVDCASPQVPLRRLADSVAGCNGKSGHPFHLSVSIGAAAFDPEAPESVESLMQRADAAMYQQKRTRRAPDSGGNGQALGWQ
jgi:diguanylate cyclase (GGDEF)-like protein/PAS domain S-box-containing protein